MWSRTELKARAKASLRPSYWKAFLVSIVFGFFGGTSNTGGVNTNYLEATNSVAENFTTNAPSFGELTMPSIPNVWDYIFSAGFGILVIFILLAGIAFSLLLASPMEVNCRRYFTSAACYQFNWGELGFSFSNGRYWGTVKGMLLPKVYLFLWGLPALIVPLLFILGALGSFGSDIDALFPWVIIAMLLSPILIIVLTIPAIIKGFAYRMVPYILADNPYIGAKRALEMSCQMTHGHKLSMWVLDLSFIGWYLLSAITCGIGLLFLNPYVNATQAELYMYLRHNAISCGITSREELGLA